MAPRHSPVSSVVWGAARMAKGLCWWLEAPRAERRVWMLWLRGTRFGLALHAVAAVEVDQLPLCRRGRSRQAEAALSSRMEPLPSFFQQGSPGDDVGLGKDAVQQGDGQAVDLVFQLEAEGLAGAVLRAGGGQAGQGVFAGHGLGRDETEVRRPAAVGAGQAQAADPVIPYAAAGVFLAEGVQGIVPLAVHPGGLGGKSRSRNKTPGRAESLPPMAGP